MLNTVLFLDISNITSREEIHRYVIGEFLKEDPGSGSGYNASKYRYNVEILSSGQKIFIERPARLNKGMDFIVNVENISFYSNKPNKNGNLRRLPAPAHHNIISDLSAKKDENQAEYNRLLCEIENIFNTQNYIHDSFSFTSGMPVEMLLGIIKWFFIEQDVTYWNWSGRAMLMTEIRAI